MIESQIVARVLPSKCREAVKVLLQEVYGYEDFRNLEVYEGQRIFLVGKLSFKRIA